MKLSWILCLATIFVVDINHHNDRLLHRIGKILELDESLQSNDTSAREPASPRNKRQNTLGGKSAPPHGLGLDFKSHEEHGKKTRMSPGKGVDGGFPPVSRRRRDADSGESDGKRRMGTDSGFPPVSRRRRDAESGEGGGKLRMGTDSGFPPVSRRRRDANEASNQQENQEPEVEGPANQEVVYASEYQPQGVNDNLADV